MKLQNLHTHSVYCDGKNTLEEMCERATELSFDSIGFSRHANMFYDSPFVKPHLIPEYFEKAKELKEKYEGRLEIFCGAEFDLFSTESPVPYDYIITSVHYMEVDGEYVAFDRSAVEVKNMVDKYFGGDGLKFVKKAYEESTRIGDFKTDIVGHFDLVTKHAETTGIFDENSKEYKALALEAVQAIAEKVKVFEINTGCVSRGYRSNPYLAPFIIEELKRLGCQVCITSDCHDKDYFDICYNEARERLISCGFKNIVILTKDGFKEEAII